ncbi:OmpH family outer membrane protein [Mesobacterium pallidum]|uniref:OmpH family outer membrane protein n=1 Tax=Mesobacterium pallidum TaxID=2872037 RepID=UPI001EE15937|nr:OmpH family outer membrane protein [Mesobacterium pallidum]
MAMLLTRRIILTGLAALAFLPGPAAAQELGRVSSPILIIESERILTESAYGKRLAAELEALSAELSTENRSIEAQLIEEERALTERRPNLSPAEFRELADAFDAKVVEIRREQDGKARSLGQRGEEIRREVLVAATPVLEDIMLDAGAAVIVERRSVFMSADVIDVTDLAIQQMDERLGDGADATPEAPPPEGATRP